MKYFLYCIVIFVFASCKNNSIQYNCQIIENAEYENYPTVDLAAEEFPLNDSTLLNPRNIWVDDSLLIIFDSPENDDNMFLKYYSLNSLQLIRSFGTIGRGPDEYLTPRILWNTKNSFLIIEKLKYSILFTDSILHHPNYNPQKHYVQFGLNAASEVYLMNDSLLFIHSMMTDEQFSINNSNNGNYISKFTNYPHYITSNKLNDFICNSKVYNATYLLKPYSFDTLAIIYKYFPVIDIVTMKDLKVKRIQFPIDKNINQVKILDKLNAALENERKLYTNYTYSEKYFYLLYNGLAKENVLYNKSFEIHKFDWEGNLIVRYKLDNYIDRFCIDEKNGKIFACSIEDDDSYTAKILTFHINN